MTKYLYATANAPNGVQVAIHKIHSTQISGDTVVVTINSFANETSELVAWQDRFEMPLSSFMLNTYPDCVWDWLIGSSIYPAGAILEDATLEIDKIKTKRKIDVNNERDRRIRNGYTVDGIGKFETDPISIRNVQGAVQMAVISTITSQPFEISWRLADNTTVTLTAMQLIGVGAALTSYVGNCYTASWLIKASIEAAETIEDVNAIDISTGWPLNEPIEQSTPSDPGGD